MSFNFSPTRKSEELYAFKAPTSITHKPLFYYFTNNKKFEIKNPKKMNTKNETISFIIICIYYLNIKRKFSFIFISFSIYMFSLFCVLHEIQCGNIPTSSIRGLNFHF